MRTVSDWGKWCSNPNNLYVGRPHPILGSGGGFGNPYQVKKYGRKQAVELYKHYCLPKLTSIQIETLQTKRVYGCWCNPDELCHSDLLLGFVR